MSWTKTHLTPAVLVFTLAAISFRCDHNGTNHPPPPCPHERPFCCDDGECHQCCTDDDCLGYSDLAGCILNDYVCNEEYQCECFCYDCDVDCSREPAGCCEGLACDIFTNKCVEPCASNQECQARNEIPFHEDLECDDGVCDFDHCLEDADCPGGRVCYGGGCVTIPDCADLNECVVAPAHAVTNQSARVRFAASAYLKSGALAPGIAFLWDSSDTEIATVDAGLVAGGSGSGAATITATVAGCEPIACAATVFNYGEFTGARLVAADDLVFEPIDGAVVRAGAEAPVTTDADGVAALPVEPSAQSPVDITVSSEEYQTTTMKGVEPSDILAHLRKNWNAARAGGARGNLDLSRIRCEQQTCDVNLGFSGFSVPGSPVDFILHFLYPEMLTTTIELGGSVEEIPLPGGLVLGLNDTWMNEIYRLTGIPGKRVLWAWGGTPDLSWFMQWLNRLVGDDYLTSLCITVQAIHELLPYFYTALVPNVEITPIGNIPDGYDIDGDGDSTELVPDYGGFPFIEVALQVPMEERMVFTAPALPVNVYDTVILLAGVVVRGAGFVPLGVGAGLDVASSDSYNPDGIIEDPMTLLVSDVAGRIPEDQVQRVVLALALNSYSFHTDLEKEQPLRLGVQVIFLDSFDGEIALDEFPAPPGTSFDPATRHLEVTSVPPGTDYIQATFRDKTNNTRHVLAEDASGLSLDLPEASPEKDRADRIRVLCIDLQDGVSYHDLLAFNDTNIGDLAELTRAFSMAEVP